VAAKKVVFVCIGNACRSQMAEAFARAYGRDVLIPSSAGLAPATMIPAITLDVMQEKNVPMDCQFPKDLRDIPLQGVELLLNLSGKTLHGVPVPEVREWRVRDPIGYSGEVHRQVRDEIERLVMALVVEMRRAASC